MALSRASGAARSVGSSQGRIVARRTERAQTEHREQHERTAAEENGAGVESGKKPGGDETEEGSGRGRGE